MARLPDGIERSLIRMVLAIQSDLSSQIKEAPRHLTHADMIEAFYDLRSMIDMLDEVRPADNLRSEYSWVSQLIIVSDFAQRLAETFAATQGNQRVKLLRDLRIDHAGYATISVGTPLAAVLHTVSIMAENEAFQAERGYALPLYDNLAVAEEDDFDILHGDPDPVAVHVEGEFARRRFPTPHREFILLLNAAETALRPISQASDRLSLKFVARFVREAYELRNQPEYAQRLLGVANEPQFLQKSGTPAQRSVFNTRLPTNFANAETVKDAFALMTSLAVKAGARGGVSPMQVQVESGGSPQLSSEIEQLTKLVPDQQVAPFRFQFDGARLGIQHVLASVENEDVALVNSVKRSVIKSGEHLLAELVSSQCDRRFLVQMQDLHGEVLESRDIIFLGMRSQECQISAKALEEEFSPYYIGLLTSYFSALLDYVAQFPDWQRFLERSVSTRILDDQLIDDLRNVLSKLQPALDKPELVEPEVGQKLQWLAKLISQDRPLTQKSVMAVALSVYNLASAIVTWGIQLSREVEENGRKMAAKGIALTFLGGLSLTLWQFIPIATLIARYPWLEQALKVLKELGSLIK